MSSTVTRALILAGVAGGAYWLGRRRGAPRVELGWDYAIEVPLLLKRASNQVYLARKGKRLEDYRKAEDNSKFLQPPATNAEAHAKAGYWLAVASRLSGNKGLAEKATTSLRNATLVYEIPFSRLLAGSIGTITAEAGKAVAAVAGADRNMKSVLAILGHHASPGAIASARATRQDTDTVARAQTFATESASDVVTGITVARSVVTGEKPPGYTTMGWFFTKWGWRIGAGLAVLLALRVAFAPQYHALKGAVGGTIARARALGQAARPALPAPQDHPASGG